jgi:hypothetical protein
VGITVSGGLLTISTGLASGTAIGGAGFATLSASGADTLVATGGASGKKGSTSTTGGFGASTPRWRRAPQSAAVAGILRPQLWRRRSGAVGAASATGGGIFNDDRFQGFHPGARGLRTFHDGFNDRRNFFGLGRGILTGAGTSL